MGFLKTTGTTLAVGILCLVMSVHTYHAATAFRQIGDSPGEDVEHLMIAFDSLRRLYRLQVMCLAVIAVIIALALMAS